MKNNKSIKRILWGSIVAICCTLATAQPMETSPSGPDEELKAALVALTKPCNDVVFAIFAAEDRSAPAFAGFVAAYQEIFAQAQRPGNVLYTINQQDGETVLLLGRHHFDNGKAAVTCIALNILYHVLRIFPKSIRFAEALKDEDFCKIARPAIAFFSEVENCHRIGTMLFENTPEEYKTFVTAEDVAQALHKLFVAPRPTPARQATPPAEASGTPQPTPQSSGIRGAVKAAAIKVANVASFLGGLFW